MKKTHLKERIMFYFRDIESYQKIKDYFLIEGNKLDCKKLWWKRN